MIAEQFDVHRIHCRVVIHIGQEHSGLSNQVHGSTLAFEQPFHVGHSLTQLRLESAWYERAVGYTNLARTDEPVSGANDGCIWTYWL
jgi:hypothetical protein